MNPKLEVAKKPGELGMMAMAANPSNVIALAPPQIVNKDDIDEGIAIMDQALEAADVPTEAKSTDSLIRWCIYSHRT